MKIYTKTGDEGMTSLVGGARVRKNIPQVEAYGTLDELVAHLGFLRASVKGNEEIGKEILAIQYILFQIGAILSSDLEKKNNFFTEFNIKEKISWLENRIDEIQQELSPIKEFVVPGSDQQSSLYHLCRTVCRRLERRILDVENLPEEAKVVNVFINRLSDYLFVYARKIENKA